MSDIGDNYRKLRDSIPEEVVLVVASKTRTPDEVEEVVRAGATDIGENYAYPEAYEKIEMLGDSAKKVRWHLIGHLQKNKINKALPIFDFIQTVESTGKARHINKRVKKAGKSSMPILLEINSGREKAKYGFPPDFDLIVEAVIKMKEMENLQIRGLMTMGPYTGDPEDARPYFKITRDLFEKLKDVDTNNCKMEVLSMGMSNSYKVAIDEGSNMVRIGSLIFGKRK